MNTTNNNAKDINDIVALAEAFLYTEGGTLSFKRLAQLLGVDAAKVHETLDELRGRLEGRGLTLVTAGSEATLAVAAGPSKAVAAALEKELGREIGDAGLEVLSILLYRGSSTRAQVDYIRGVNTSSTMRTLLARGLVDRSGNPEDAREFLYRPTAELLAHLGVRSVEELADYNEIRSELAAFEANAHAGDGEPETHHGTTD